MVKTALMICVLLGFVSGSHAQDKKRGSYAAVTVFKEFDLFSRNAPYGVSGVGKAGRFFLQGDYRYSLAKITDVTVLAPVQTYGGKVGFMGGGLSEEGISNFGLSLGARQVNSYKRLAFDNTDFPVDVNGKAVEVEKVNTLISGTEFSVGFLVLNVNINKTGKAESLIDDFDLKMNRNKVRYSTVLMSIEMLYMPKISYSRTFAYSPYGYYVPRDVTFNAKLKERHFGVKMRVEFAPYTKTGFFFEMGITPGISHKTDNYNDFGMGVRAGFLINISAFTKAE